MFIDGKEIFRQSKQRFRRQRIHLSRIFVTDDGKQLEPVLDSEFYCTKICFICIGNLFPFLRYFLLFFHFSSALSTLFHHFLFSFFILELIF